MRRIEKGLSWEALETYTHLLTQWVYMDSYHNLSKDSCYDLSKETNKRRSEGQKMWNQQETIKGYAC